MSTRLPTVDQEPEPTASGCCIQPVAPLELRAADEELARLAKALGHPVRVAIVRHLLQLGERVCTDLSDVVPLAHSTAIQHINVLREAGLLCASRSGRNVYYCVNAAALRQIKALIAGL